MKFTATLQAAQAADTEANPILLRMDTATSHGLGKPTAKAIEELSDIYTFLCTVFGMAPPAS